MMQFVHESASVRVVFGAGSIAHLKDEVARLGFRRVLTLSTSNKRNLAEHAMRVLEDRAAGMYTRARMHVPVETAVEACTEATRLELSLIHI
ncbi:MAG: hypothetical protein J7454_14770, partial [Roseiflexus sp.]|nr:hypothetical protein [Roseiflexus sp.]